jgi:hypothetical protein
MLCCNFEPLPRRYVITMRIPMHRIRTCLFACLCLAACAYGQDNSLPRRYFTGGFNFGMVGWSPSRLVVDSGSSHFQRTLTGIGLGEVEDVHGNKRISLTANTSIGLAGGFLCFTKTAKDFFGVQLEFQQNKACYEFDPPFLWNTGRDTFKNWIETDKYMKYAAAFQYGHYLNENAFGYRYLYTRASFGQTFNHRNFADPLVQGYTEDWTFNGTGMQLKDLVVNQRTYMIGAELGFKSFSDDNTSSFDLGLSYYAPFVSTYTRQYAFFQQGVETGKSSVTFKGNTLMFNFRYTYNIPIRNRERRPRDTVKVKEHHEQVLKKVNGRDLDIQYKMKTRFDSVVIEVWDKGRIDGDQVSLYLNNELIQDGIQLEKEKKRIVLHLQPGVNYLVINALNLGSIPPNTAAMYIYNGTEKISVKISSTIGTSGAVEIVCRKW